MLSRAQLIRRAAITAGVLACLVSAPAHAHSAFPGMSDFWNGFLHLVFAAEQCIALLALGLIMARLETDKAEAPFHFYLAAFAVGLVLGVALLPPEIAVLRAVPLVVVGLLLIDPGGHVHRFPRAVVVVAALVTGMSFGSAVPPDVSRFVFGGGMFLGAILFPTYAMVLWERLYAPWFRIAVRIVGSWMAAIGIILFGAAFR